MADTILSWPQPNQTIMNYIQAGGGHVVVRVSLNCECGCDALTCRAYKWTAVFDTDPTDNFELAGSIDPDDALRLFRLYRAGKVRGLEQYPEWEGHISPMRRVYSIKQSGDTFALQLTDAACNLSLVVRPEGDGDDEVLRIVQEPEQGCS